MTIFPDNTLSDFTVDLPQPLDLAGDWVVALSEIQYPHTWNNVREHSNAFYTARPGETVNRYEIQAGFYKSVQQLISVMSNHLGELSPKDLTLSFDEVTRHVQVEVKSNVTLNLGKGLDTILGFERDYPISKTTKSPRVASLDGGFHSLYVYSDVVDPRMVGDAMVPLLRIVGIEGSDGQSITKTFQNPFYVPVSRKRVDRIQCSIKDDTNQLVPFESGKLIVTLHFKKSKPFYL